MRLYRATFVGGLAVGYVLGTRAGRERYDQMRRLVRSVADHPAVQQAAGALQAHATSTLKSSWNQLSAQARRRVTTVTGRLPGRSSAMNSAAGNGHAQRPSSGNRRPFVPVDGDLGDQS